jgi:type I restriction enzyme M protein
VLDADGKETGRNIVYAGQAVPAMPEGGTVKTAPLSRILPNEHFGYHTITVERPLLDEKGKPVLGIKGKQKGKIQPDTSLRDTENVPLDEDVESYFKREVLPHVSDAWIDHEKTKVGYEIPFNRHFYVFEPPRDLEAIDRDLAEVSGNIMKMLRELGA